MGTLDSPTELRLAAAPADGFGGAPDEGEPGGHGQEGSAEGPSDGSSDGPSDGELAERAGRGDRRAFDTLTHRYHRQAVAVAYRLLGDSQDALDVAQEALFKAYTGLAGLEDPAAFGGWLMRIVSNLALNLRRGRRVRRTTGLDHVAAGAVAADPSARHNPPDPLDPARASESSEMAERLRDALAALPDKQREALVLFTMQGHSAAAGGRRDGVQHGGRQVERLPGPKADQAGDGRLPAARPAVGQANVGAVGVSGWGRTMSERRGGRGRCGS